MKWALTLSIGFMLFVIGLAHGAPHNPHVIYYPGYPR